MPGKTSYPTCFIGQESVNEWTVQRPTALYIVKVLCEIPATSLPLLF